MGKGCTHELLGSKPTAGASGRWTEVKGLLPTVALEAGTELSQSLKAGNGPAHAGLFETMGDDMFTAAFDGAAADLESELSIEGITHAVLVVGEVADR